MRDRLRAPWPNVRGSAGGIESQRDSGETPICATLVTIAAAFRAASASNQTQSDWRMPVALEDPPEAVFVTEIEPLFCTWLEPPEIETPWVVEVIAPLLMVVVGVEPVTVTPAWLPPSIVPLLTMVVVGVGVV